MIPIVDPQQNRLFDPLEGVIPPAGQRIISSGWQGVVRDVLRELSVTTAFHVPTYYAGKKVGQIFQPDGTGLLGWKV